MNNFTRPAALGGALACLALMVASCGNDSQTSSPAPSSATTAAMPTETDTITGTGSSGATDAVQLGDVCPNPLVIQMDWHPQSEYGALFNLIGDDYSINAGDQRLTGPLVTEDGPTGIDLELRAGGPAIGFTPPRSQIYTDDSIHLAQSNLDAQIIQWQEAPLIAVAGPLDKNPQILMWDAETYPEIDTIEELGDEGVTVNTFGTGGYIEIFVAEGILDADQIDPAYDGTPSRFIAERTIAQQGFASAEPFTYENVYTEYGKAPAYQLLHDAGFETYSQTLALPPDRLEELRPCLERFVPMVQRSVVEFAAEPDRAIDIVVDFVDTVDGAWVQTVELGQYAVETMNELELHGNGADAVVANFDLDRVDGLLTQIRDAGVEVDADLTVDDLVTNEFIEPGIGFDGPPGNGG